MPIIDAHDITLYGSTPTVKVILRPLCDEHLPLLYRWHLDEEVLFWSEGGWVQRGDERYVQRKFGGERQKILYFLIEADGIPVGYCWLQRMNLPDVAAMYPAKDVRRIDMAIGEKAYWGKGIGTAFIRMLIDFAFTWQGIDVLHTFAEDTNIRSQRVWLKNGLRLVRADKIEDVRNGEYQLHFAITRQEFINSRRVVVPPEQIFYLGPEDLQPSQLYISEGKLNLVKEWFDPGDPTGFDALPVKLVDGRYMLTDGHTRAVAAMLAGWERLPVYLDTDELDMDAYRKDIVWCRQKGISSATDLAGRIVSPREYEELWRRRCLEDS